MPRFGAHLSFAGGIPRAVDRAVATGCDALQIFTKSTGQWRARELPDEEVRAFRRKADEAQLSPRVAHLGMVIETPKQQDAPESDAFDRENLRVLRGLMRPHRRRC